MAYSSKQKVNNVRYTIKEQTIEEINITKDLQSKRLNVQHVLYIKI